MTPLNICVSGRAPNYQQTPLDGTNNRRKDSLYVEFRKKTSELGNICFRQENERRLSSYPFYDPDGEIRNLLANIKAETGELLPSAVVLSRYYTSMALLKMISFK